MIPVLVVINRAVVQENIPIQKMERKVDKLEQNVTQVFKVVFERLDNLEEVAINQKKRKKIGLNSKD